MRRGTGAESPGPAPVRTFTAPGQPAARVREVIEILPRGGIQRIHLQVTRPPRGCGRRFGDAAVKRPPTTPTGSAPPLVPNRLVRTLYEHIDPVWAPRHAAWRRVEDAAQRFPAGPTAGIVKMPELVFGTVREHVQPAHSPGGHDGIRGQRASEALPSAPGAAAPPFVPKGVIATPDESIDPVLIAPGDRRGSRGKGSAQVLPGCPAGSEVGVKGMVEVVVRASDKSVHLSVAGAAGYVMSGGARSAGWSYGR